jgi:class 3 adenylate cyclase/tetratricopeptide (TPR) repeat protein
MSVGLHSGAVDFFLVGGSHRELLLLGPAADKVVDTENTANAREVVVSAETAALLPSGATKPRPDGELLLRWRKAPIAAHQSGEVSSGDDDSLESLFPSELGAYLAPGAPDPEHRVACIAFIRFSGTDALLANEGPEALAEALQTMVSAVQAVLVDEGVTLLAVDLDKDGGKFFLAAGVPHAHEDDEGVMLRAMRRIADSDMPLALQIGVNRGHVFAAEVGTARRAAFSAMGDTTNTAARITAQTPAGSIYAHPAVLDECLTLFEVAPAGPLTMKGKTAPQAVYAVGDELGLREREGLEVEEFVGRDAELQTLLTAIDKLATGDGQVISMVGETGLGKTRLLAEATSRAEGVQLLSLRAEPYGANSSYRMFRDPFRSLLGIERGDAKSMARALKRSIEDLDDALLPWLPLVANIVQVDAEPSAEVDALDPQFRPERTAEAAIGILDNAITGSLILAVDEAHWCDEASVQLLGHLEHACARRPWLMLVAHRDADTGFRPESSTFVAVDPLADADIRRLVRLATEAAPLRPQEIDTIVERAAGVPLFATEIVRAVRDLGSLNALPESLEAALAAQIDALDGAARRTLRVASVLGRSFSLDVLEALLNQEGHSVDGGTLERLDGFLDTDGHGRARFRSGLIQRTTYEGVAYRLRTRAHALAAETMRQQVPDPNSIADSLALHYSRGADASNTWHFARIAADRAREAYANTDAARFYEMALEAARRTNEAQPRDCVQLWRELGDVRELAGLFEESLAAYRRALTLTDDDPINRAELLLGRAKAKERAGAFSSALRDLSVGRRLLSRLETRDARQTRARLMSFAAMVLFGQDRPRKALNQALIAIDEARSSGEEVSLGRALIVVDLANLSLEGPGDGQNLIEALAIFERLGDIRMQANARANLGFLCGHAGRWDEAVEWLKSGSELDRQNGDSVGGAYSGLNIGEILVNQGRLDEAEIMLIDAQQVMRASDFVEGEAMINILLGRILIERGSYEKADLLLAKTVDDFELLHKPMFALEAAIVRAEGQTRCHAPETALELLDEATLAAGADAKLYLARSAHARGRALMALGHDGEAREVIEAGLDEAKAKRLRYEEALLLKARGEPGDEEAARSILEGLGVVATPRPAHS